MANTTLPEPYNAEIDGEFQIPAPAEVRWALKLLWLSLALAVVQYVLFLPGAVSALPTDPAARGPAIFGLAIPILAYIFGGYLNVKIARNRNWARITKLMFAVASLVLQVVFSRGLTGFEYLSVGIAPALNFSALYLLFVSSGRLWFRQALSRTEV